MAVTSGRAASASDPLIGQILDGRYEIVALLGKGSMGRVYHAQHTVLRKTLAIKILHNDPHSAHQLTRFRQEAQAASAIGHDNIVDVIDFGMLPNNSTYFVMEYLDGVSLATFLKIHPQPIAMHDLVRIALQICDGLKAAHHAGIVHRDLKPENVYLISRHGMAHFVKLLDFGIAKVKGTRTITQDGQIMGTPAYMSPEQCTGRQVDQRTDIYSLGVILYEMASGKVPFFAEHWLGIVGQHTQQKPPPLPVGTPLQLSKVIMRCLAKDPAQRYVSMEHVAADLCAIPGMAPDALTVHGVNQNEIQTRPNRPTTRLLRWLRYKGKRLGAPIFMGTVLVATLLGLAVPAAVSRLRGLSKSARSQGSASASPSTAASNTTRIDAKPVQALLYQGDQLIGLTPQTITLPTRGDNIEVSLKQTGYKTHRMVLTANSPAELNVMLNAASTEQIKPADPSHKKTGPSSPSRSKSLEQLQDPWD